MQHITFGDDAFVALATTQDTDYETLYPIVDAVIRPFVLARLEGHVEQREELLQDIHLAVWKHLPSFLAQSRTFTPRQRLGWLYAVAASKLNDRFRAMRADTDAALNESIPDPAGSPESLFLHAVHREETAQRIDAVIRTACGMRSRPETTLAFLYNRVIMPLEQDHIRKGDIQAVLAHLQGKTLRDIRGDLERDLSHALGRPIPRDALAGLDRSLQGQETHRFQLSARQVATASHSVCAALSAALYPVSSATEAHRCAKSTALLCRSVGFCFPDMRTHSCRLF